MKLKLTLTVSSFITLLTWLSYAHGEEKMSSKFRHESLHAVVVEADVSRINQVRILGIYPDASAFIHKEFAPKSQGNTGRPAGLSLDARNVSFTLPVQSEWRGGRPTPGWVLKHNDLSRFMQQMGLASAEKFYPKGKNGEDTFYFDLQSIGQGESIFYLLPRVEDGLESSKVKYKFGSPTKSIALEFISDNSWEEYLKGIETASTLSARATGEEISAAWNRGAKLFGRHYQTFGVSIYQTLEGPDREEPRKSLGDFALVAPRLETAAMLVLPQLESPEENGDLNASARPAFEPIVATAATINAEKVENVRFDAAQILKQVLAPSLLRGSRETELKCLEQKPNVAEASGCIENDGNGFGKVIYFTRQDSNRPDLKSVFYVTDSEHGRIWLIEMRIQGPGQIPLQGEYSPVQRIHKK